MTRIRSGRTEAAAGLFLALGLWAPATATAQVAAPAAPAAVRTIAQAPDQFFTRGGARLRYREAGRGQPVVLLHGWTQRIELMEDLADSLSGAFRVIVLDERGFGESTKFSEPKRYGQAMVEDVIGLLDLLKIPRAHLVGHSMGALVAAQTALRHPGRVASASLVAGPFTPDSAAFSQMTEPFVQALERGQGITEFIKWIFPGTPDSMAAAFSAQAMSNSDLGSLIATMRSMGGLVPPAGRRPGRSTGVLIAVGTADPLLPQSQALKGAWPEAQYVEVPGANHDQIRAHGATVAAIRRVVEQSPAPAVVPGTTASLVAQTRRPAASFSVVEAGIADLRTALEQHRTTSHEIVQQYLLRIATYEDRLNAIVTVNPNALAIADSLDRLRARGVILGPLHGIPVALKDNIHTVEMPTTGGALAFADLVPPYDATLTRNLKAAGAIILAKTQLTELANWVASGMPGNYNALTGYGMNPWDPRRDPRDNTFDGRPVLTTGGSSSGVGTNVSFWAANVGTETSGSILSPANQNMLAAIKPTVGRVSRYGVIPISADQDTPGPMARSVRDAAIMFGVLESAQPDTNDAATKKCQPPPARDYTKFLNANGLTGARIGIPRAFFYDSTTAGRPTGSPRGGLSVTQRKVMDDAIAVLKAQGAVIVDPADIPSVIDSVPANNFLNWGVCGGLDQAKGRDADCSIAFKYGMKRDFNTWLKSLGAAAPVKTLADLRAWNIAHQRAGAIKYGQANLDVSDEMDLQADRARYESDRRKDILLSATNGLDAALKANQLDALLFPAVNSANIAARPGYPTVTVPFGFVPVPAGTGATAFPTGFEPKPAPYNVSFTGTACSEPKLIELAYAFEQATKKRIAPPLFP